MEHPINYQVDLRGLCCAQPIIKLTAELKRVGQGEVLLVIADKSSMSQDVPAYCRQTGNALIHTDNEDGLLKFWIRKA